MTAWRLAARLARREVRQRPWRTVLVAFLVAIPVAAASILAVLLRTDSQTDAERWRHMNGAADAAFGPHTAVRLVPADLPSGSRVVSFELDFRLARTADGRHLLTEISNLAVSDPVAAGIVEVVGRAPEAANEVLLSEETARKLGVGIGGTLDLDRPLDAVLTVVGIGKWHWLDLRAIVLHPSASFPVRPGDRAAPRHLVAFPDTMPIGEITAWAGAHSATDALSPGLVDQARLDFDDDGQVGVQWSWVGAAVLLTVLGIVIAAAFAAGARRQLTTLGQLAANGASPGVLRRVLVLQGSWTGGVGAVLGLALGAGALVAIAPYRERIIGRRIASYDVNLTDVLPILLLGILAATIAAVVPARSASRVPVMAALAGRRPQGAVPRWLAVAGLAVCGSGLGLLALAMFGVRAAQQGDGTVWGLTAIAGGVAMLLGACAIAPGYVNVLGPAAARLGGSWRLAVRSLARQRGRTGAVVSAVCATTALLLAWSAIIHSTTAQAQRAAVPADRVLISARTAKPLLGPTRAPSALSPPPAAFVDKVRGVLDDSQVHQLRWVPLGNNRQASVADETFLDALGFDAASRRTLARTGVAVLGRDGAADEGIVTFVPSNGSAPVAIPASTIDGTPEWLQRVPAILITPERVASLGLVPQPGDIVVQQSHDLTSDQRDAVEGVFEEGLDAIPRTQPVGSAAVEIVEVEYARLGSAPDPLVLDAIFAAVAFLFVLFVVASSLALAAAETRGERDLLTVMGASPKVIRRTSGVKAVVLTVFGVVLALPVGLLPVVLFSRIMEGGMPFVVPWRAILLVVVVVPIAAGLITTSASALALRLRPVRTSTMAFE